MLAVGLFTCAAALAFPPWQVVSVGAGGHATIISEGFAPIFSPLQAPPSLRPSPAKNPWDEYFAAHPEDLPYKYEPFRARIDASRLLVELGATVALFSGVLALTGLSSLRPAGSTARSEASPPQRSE